eukprot:10386779-Lingulodinium_polyedra.AAC.1
MKCNADEKSGFAKAVHEIIQAQGPEMMLDLQAIHLAVAACWRWWESTPDIAVLVLASVKHARAQFKTP